VILEDKDKGPAGFGIDTLYALFRGVGEVFIGNGADLPPLNPTSRIIVIKTNAADAWNVFVTSLFGDPILEPRGRA
jgi:hypothetical protein